MSEDIKPIGALESLGYIWGAAAFVGFGAMALLYFMGDWTALQAIFTGGAIGFTVGVVLTVLFGVSSAPSPAGQAARSDARGMNAVERAMASRPDTAKVLAPVPSPHKTGIDPSPISDAMGINAGAAGAAAAAGARLAAESEAQVKGIAVANGKAAPAAAPEADRVAPIGAAAAAEERSAARSAAAAESVPPIGAAVVADETAGDMGDADDADEGDTAAGSSSDDAEAPAGTEPERLSAARDGGPDDLKQIKGVGPKLEALLHSMGFYHFDQIANWGPDEVAWVDQNLQGFKGRVSRDDWVDQARLLAAGEETEFSKKVAKGDVY